MSIAIETLSFESARRIYRVLTMYFLEHRKQAEIAALTSQSVATVNRLIRQGRDLGMVEITLKSPFQAEFDLEGRLLELAGLTEAVVTPTVSMNDDINLRTVGAAAAELLLSRIRDGDVICITGGKGVSALVEALQPARQYDVLVVPALGCVQGKHYTDVNHVSSEMAAKLGGKAYQIHAPMFADTAQERATLMSMRAVSEILDRARQASIAIVGIGSIRTEGSSYFDLNPRALGDREAIEAADAQSELLAHLLDANGNISPYAANTHLIGLTPEELGRIPFSFAVAAGPNKVAPITSVLKTSYLKGLATDEKTAVQVLASLAPKEKEPGGERR